MASFISTVLGIDLGTSAGEAEGDETPASHRTGEKFLRLQKALSHSSTITSDSIIGETGSRHARAGKTRDQMIFDILDIHPVIAEQLVRMRLFPTVKIAQRRLLKLVQKKKVHYCGSALMHDRGRPCNVYARWRPKHDNLRHEILLTEFLLPFIDAEIVRGYEIRLPQRPDAKMTINGLVYLVEMDCGTMSYRDIVQKRFKKYEDYDGIVLWVCPTDVRKQGLIDRAERVKHNALFTTFAATLTEPFGGVWVDYDGQISSVPKPEEKFGA